MCKVAHLFVSIMLLNKFKKKKMKNLTISLYLCAELDFRFPVGAPIHGIRAFLTTNQLKVIELFIFGLTFTLPIMF